jgi:hypothetical protein
MIVHDRVLSAAVDILLPDKVVKQHGRVSKKKNKSFLFDFPRPADNTGSLLSTSIALLEGFYSK